MFKRIVNWFAVSGFTRTASFRYYEGDIVGNRAGYWQASTSRDILGVATLTLAMWVPISTSVFFAGALAGSVTVAVNVVVAVAMTAVMHKVVSPAMSVEVAQEVANLHALRRQGRISRAQARKVRAHLRGADRELADARAAVSALKAVRVRLLDDATAQEVAFELRVRSEQVDGLVSAISEYSVKKGIDPDYERSAAFEEAAVALRASRTAAANMAGVPLQARASSPELGGVSSPTYVSGHRQQVEYPVFFPGLS